MPGRPLPDESAMRALGYGGADMVRRREVLRETLDRFETAEPPDRYHRMAHDNLARWRAEGTTPRGAVEVVAGDWGEVAGEVTRRYGACFAVLNMANTYVPGGGYVEGMVAQEENMFRRTDCHFHVGPDEYDADMDRYLPHVTRLLTGETGRVHLDTERPRVCLRAAEDRARPDLGYDWLGDEEMFPFYELRASAQYLRNGAPFDPEDARRRIAAQLDTLRDAGLGHAVLGAFGCGAFRNPASEVARIYREEIDARRADFALIVFAIFHAGYGPDNFTPFRNAFA